MIDLHEITREGTVVPVSEASFPAPFPSGLEYAAPARGSWNIVHVGMLIPESHQIFVCAEGCLRGVVLTAAEMGAFDRFSTIAVQENNLLDGDMEQLILDGVDEIFSGMEKLPRALLLYTSCIHHFTGCDMDYVFKKLREKYPAVDFTDCYMNPIMRKSKLPPDATMRRQLYSLLKPAPREEKLIAILGNNERLSPEGEMMELLRAGGYEVLEIAGCKNYEEYQRHAAAALSITTNPAAVPGGEALEKRLSIPHLHLPLSYDFEEIEGNLRALCGRLSLPMPDTAALRKEAEEALAHAARELDGTAVSIDYTATSRPLGLAKLLLEHGFRVVSVYADSFSAAEKPAFGWLREHAPELTLRPTVQMKMGLLPRDEAAQAGGLLAIGQKAAFFTGTEYFVNLLEGGGFYGFMGIKQLAGQMEADAKTRKDVPSIIQVKGWGCSC